MQSTNPDGVVLETAEYPATDYAEASSMLVGELYSAAADSFLCDALRMWFTTGKIDKISENVNDTAFWSVVLLDDDGNEVLS